MAENDDERVDYEPTISYEIAVKSIHTATPFGAR